MDFRDIGYLETGTPRQQRAYRTLSALRLFDRLAPYKPLLAGTIPLSLATDSSDLDILCHSPGHHRFARSLQQFFGTIPGFRLQHKLLGREPTTLCSFRAGGFTVEIAGQAIPPTRQVAFRHLITEQRILDKYGPEFKRQVIALKEKGMKTEPAFARLLGLSGDPYQALLEWRG